MTVSLRSVRFLCRERVVTVDHFHRLAWTMLTGIGITFVAGAIGGLAAGSFGFPPATLMLIATGLYVAFRASKEAVRLAFEGEALSDIVALLDESIVRLRGIER